MAEIKSLLYFLNSRINILDTVVTNKYVGKARVVVCCVHIIEKKWNTYMLGHLYHEEYFFELCTLCVDFFWCVVAVSAIHLHPCWCLLKSPVSTSAYVHMHVGRLMQFVTWVFTKVFFFLLKRQCTYILCDFVSALNQTPFTSYMQVLASNAFFFKCRTYRYTCIYTNNRNFCSI